MTRDILIRNNAIINEVMQKIENTCPGSVDMIAITGSFAMGDYHDKSDLDLVIIRNNDDAKRISTCFIMDDIGYDIYTTSWDDLKKMSKYENPYVSKLKQLDVIYTKNNDVREKYRELQSDLNDNMNNEEVIKENVSKHFSKILDNYSDILNCKNISEAYKILGNFMINLENIIYLVNKKYVSNGVKNIPIEIAQMKDVPRDIVSNYLKLPECKNISQIIEKMFEIEKSLHHFLKEKNIIIDDYEQEKEIKEKKELKSEDLTGSFEKLYSNYYNKLKHAAELEDRYSSFRTMVDAQNFYDEYSDNYNVEEVDLLGRYSPEDLNQNFKSFVYTLKEWKSLYDSFYKKVKIVNKPSDIYLNKNVFEPSIRKEEKDFFERLDLEDKDGINTKGSYILR